MKRNIVKHLLRENLNVESSLLEIKDELDFSAFKMNDTLNPYFWKGEEAIGQLLMIIGTLWN